LIYTVHSDGDPVWDLPEELRSVEEDCGLPTKNLLGWNLATTLSSEQRMGLEGAGVSADDLEMTNQQFQLDKGLFEKAGDFVRKLGSL
jgi:hypothetical protein